MMKKRQRLDPSDAEHVRVERSSFVECTSKSFTLQSKIEQLERGFKGIRRVLDPSHYSKELVARDKEREIINEFVDRCGRGKKGANMLYISGVPGTGKTSCVRRALDQAEINNLSFERCEINGMLLRQPLDTFTQIFPSLRRCLSNKFIVDKGIPRTASGKVALSFLRITLEAQRASDEKKNKRPPMQHPLIVVLDEMDTAVGKTGSEVLFDLTDLSQLTPKFAFIGIANRQNLGSIFSIDGKEVTKRVQSRIEKFQSIIFGVYTKEQLCAITTSRLREISTESEVTETSGKGTVKLISVLHGTDFFPEDTLAFAMTGVCKYASGDCRQALLFAKHLAYFKETALTQIMQEADTTTGSRSLKSFTLKENFSVSKELVGDQMRPFLHKQDEKAVTPHELIVLCIVSYEDAICPQNEGFASIQKIIQRYQIFAPQLKAPAEPEVVVGDLLDFEDLEEHSNSSISSDDYIYSTTPPEPIYAPLTPLELSHECNTLIASLLSRAYLLPHATVDFKVSLPPIISRNILNMLKSCPSVAALPFTKKLQENDNAFAY
eukprot:TRINITY_DN7721_c3_g1_i1.p1 TRINITY_DN7721_c3_g1~~TRINITY_DN7721_c3_g1_i1.p1  ORF type:complete len:550 (+),score=99.23 TRINITY_DN7721_c3_g1_i1:2035-3684(+)